MMALKPFGDADFALIERREIDRGFVAQRLLAGAGCGQRFRLADRVSDRRSARGLIGGQQFLDGLFGLRRLSFGQRSRDRIDRPRA